MPPIKGDDGVSSGFIPFNPFGVWGDAGKATANGVIGSSGRSSGVAGFTAANNNRAAGVFGTGPWVGVAGLLTGATTAPAQRVGVYGSAVTGGTGGIGVMGESLSSSGVAGSSTNGAGVSGTSLNAPGVSGSSVFGDGVRGFSLDQAGVTGAGDNIGLQGLGGKVGVMGVAIEGTGLAGQFVGDVEITGMLSKGGGGFRIDHPLDPENRYLAHSFVESPDMKNFYDGIAVCGESGDVVIELPEWFVALNDDYRYQLTPLGAPAPNLHIAEEVTDNHFRIAGGAVGTRVSWQVTGVRRDAWANANRIRVEALKPRLK